MPTADLAVALLAELAVDLAVALLAELAVDLAADLAVDLAVAVFASVLAVALLVLRQPRLVGFQGAAHTEAQFPSLQPGAPCAPLFIVLQDLFDDSSMHIS